MEKSEMKEMLKANVCEIVFTKANGEKRTMKATLKADMLPVVEADSSKRTKKANDAIVACYDIEKKGWRSFRKDSVIEFKIVG